MSKTIATMKEERFLNKTYFPLWALFIICYFLMVSSCSRKTSNDVRKGIHTSYQFKSEYSLKINWHPGSTTLAIRAAKNNYRSSGSTPWEIFNSIPLQGKEVAITFHQNDYQANHTLYTNSEGEIFFNLAALPWLHKKTMLKIKATISFDDYSKNASLLIFPHELASLSIPEESPIPSPRALEYYAQGKRYYTLNKTNEAIDQFTKAIQSYPNFADAHKDLGLAYIEVKNFTQALYHFKECLCIDPDQKDASEIRKMIKVLENQVEK